MENLYNRFLAMWNDDDNKTLFVILMAVPIALIAYFKINIFGLNKKTRRRRVSTSRRSYGRSYSRRRTNRKRR